MDRQPYGSIPGQYPACRYNNNLAGYPYATHDPAAAGAPSSAPPPPTGYPSLQDPRQAFAVPRPFPASRALPILHCPVPVSLAGLDPYQRVVMAEQFAASTKEAPVSAAPDTTTAPPPAPENPTPGPPATPGPVATAAVKPRTCAPKTPARVPTAIHTHPPNQADRPRGVRTLAGPDNSRRWLAHVQALLRYEFADPDVLEEALESPDSGVACVGATHRVLGYAGNRRLAAVGKRVMELVLMDECYRAGTKEAHALLSSATSTETLHKLSRTSGLERFVHVRRGSGLWTRADAQSCSARALKAVVGAVFVDRGLDAAHAAMVHLGMKIKRSK